MAEEKRVAGPHVFKRRWKNPTTGEIVESPWYFLCYYVGSRRIVRRTNPATDSKRLATEQLRAALGGKPTTGAATASVADVLDEYAKHLQAASPSTWLRCGSRVRWWRERYGDWRADELTLLEVEAAAAGLRETLSSSTVYGLLTLLRAAFRRALKLRFIHATELQQIEIAYRPSVRKTVWTDQEFIRLIQHAPPWSRPLFSLLRETGIRIGDALTLRWEDVSGTEIRRVQQKAGDELHIPLSAASLEILRSIPRLGPWVFPGLKNQPRLYRNVLRVFHSAMKRAGISGKTIHDLRRSLASDLTNSGASDRQIAALLGQKTTSIVGRYAHAELGALRESLERVRSRKTAT
ncbi:MAG: Tyrosine recombinase XerC [Thermoanaerobaculia bacterium]|nr:Tyrosine recombinase XerC [Thermoanaerobaculia bacterium]